LTVREAYDASTSLNDLAALIGCHYQTARKMARGEGLAVPAVHWGRKPQAPPAEDVRTPTERLRDTMAVEAATAKAAEAKKLLRAAKQELRNQDEFLIEVLDACASPVAFPDVPPIDQDGHKPHRWVIIHIGDWQGGQKVSACDTGGNVYDWDIMLARQGLFFVGVVGSIRNVMRAYFIDEIVFMYTGDIIEGYKVFAEQGYQLCKDAGAQVVDAGRCWAEFEAAIAGEFPGVPLRRKAVFGNHGLPEGRKGGAVTSTVNYEYIWLNLLEANTAPLGIPSEYATDGRVLFEVAGQSCLMTHGDELRGQLGIPFYGIRTAWMKHTQELDTLFRYWFFGHIHQTSMVTYGNGAAISCGDAVGYNNLTGKLRNPSSTPQQSVYFLSRDRGLDEISYIHLGDELSVSK